MYSRMHEMCDFIDYGGADYRLLPPNGGVDDLMALWKVAGEQKSKLPTRAKSQLRAQLKPGKRVRLERVASTAREAPSRRLSASRLARSASTSTSRSARRSATTAISTAAFRRCAEGALRRGARARKSLAAPAAAPCRHRSSSAAGRRRCSSRQRSPRSSQACRRVVRRRARTRKSPSRPIRRRRPSKEWNGFRDAGVNRISFGVQSFQDAELKRLGRIHSADRARAAVREARAAGFDNVSLDLMMWLPGAVGRATGSETSTRSSKPARPCVAVPARALSERAAERGHGARRLVAGAGRGRGRDVPAGHGTARRRGLRAVRDFECLPRPGRSRGTT